MSSSRETLITLTPVVNSEITVAEANLEIAATTANRGGWDALRLKSIYVISPTAVDVLQLQPVRFCMYNTGFFLPGLAVVSRCAMYYFLVFYIKSRARVHAKAARSD